MRGAAILVLFTTGWIVVALSSVQTSPKREEAAAARLRSLTISDELRRGAPKREIAKAAPQARQGPPAIPATLPAVREVLDKYLCRLP